MSNLSYKRIFYTTLTLASLIRVYIVFFSGLSWYGPDTENYIKMAKAIVDGNPISFFPNGFPLLLAGTMFLSPGNFPVLIVLLNIVMQIAAVILMEKILSRYNIEEKTRLLIIFIIAFYPNLVNNARLILTESTSLFLIVLSLLLYTYGRYPASGFAGYLTYTFRPSLFLVFPFIIIYDLFRRKKISALKTASGFLAGLLIFLSLEWTGVVASPSSYEYNALVAINAYGYKIDFQLENASEYELKHPVETYFNFIAEHPVEYTLQRFLSLWNLWGPTIYFGYNITSFMLYDIRFPLFILAVLAFLFRNKMGYEKELIILLSFPVISLTLIHFFFLSTLRHRTVAEPFVIVLAILFLNYLVKLYKSSKIFSG